MQIRKKWLNQLKNFFNKHFKEYYFAFFWRWVPSSCENHCTLIYMYTYITVLDNWGVGGGAIDDFCENEKKVFPFNPNK